MYQEKGGENLKEAWKGPYLKKTWIFLTFSFFSILHFWCQVHCCRTRRPFVEQVQDHPGAAVQQQQADHRRHLRQA